MSRVPALPAGKGMEATAIPRFGRISASLRHFSVRDVREYAPDRKDPCSLSSDSERQRATGYWHPKSGDRGQVPTLRSLRVRCTLLTARWALGDRMAVASRLQPMTRKGLEDSGFAWLFESTFLNQMDGADQAKLLTLMSWRMYGKDAVLVVAGQKSDGMTLIVEGEAQVVIPAGHSADTLFSRIAMRTEAGDSVVAKLAPGHVFGERSLRKNTATNATVKALSPMRALHLATSDFNKAIAEMPAFRDYIDGLVEMRDQAATITDLLLRHAFLRQLGRDDIQRFVESGKLVKVYAGQQVVRKGDRTSDVYVVVRGKVGVIGGEGNAREIIATKGPGWMFGHAAILLEVARTADIDALETTDLLKVPATVMMGIITRNPTLYRHLYTELATTGVKVGQKGAHQASLVSIYGTKPGLGTTSIGWGLAAALSREIGDAMPGQDGAQRSWSASKVVFIDMGGAAAVQKMHLRTRRIEVGPATAEELLPPLGLIWPIRVLRPYLPDQTMPLVVELRKQMPHDAWILVGARSQDSHDKALLHEAQSVVLVRSSSDGSHETAAERHQYRIDAIRLTGGVIPLESTSRASRVPDDAATLRRFENSAELHLLSTEATIFGRACRRLARALIGKSVGLALGGGGALGFAHIGLIRAMEEAHIPIDYIAGVSFGSVVAGIYAAGRRDGIERLVADRWVLIPTLLAGFVSTAPFEIAVRYLLNREVMMSETEIPFFPVGVDIHTGKEVVRAHGSVGHGVRSSSCLPGAYPSLVVGGQRIVDGGMHNNVPASVVWQAGAHFIIASNIIPDFPFAPPGANSKMIDLARLGLTRFDDLMRSMFLLMSQSGRDRAQLADYVFDLQVRGFNVYDFARGDYLAKAGYEQAQAIMPDIEAAWRHQGTGVAAAAAPAQAISTMVTAVSAEPGA